jgi:hypothetical protein
MTKMGGIDSGGALAGVAPAHSVSFGEAFAFGRASPL